ncbi:vacuolar protein sorting-associated protein 13D [Elysia marginata]|uniref:Vacuolar protein sorting-associated protein 13D n=1 Tax=Elysia marginata TaxID=1093978 RepID=A0AAV4FFX0_9GAST|nr:vacuolar protein sorting-associated protein 13D [Elysia marginata]
MVSETRNSKSEDRTHLPSAKTTAGNARQSPSPPPEPAAKSAPDPASSTLFQRWFPGWSGWSSQPATTSPPAGSDSVDPEEDTSSTLSLADTPSSSVPSLCSSASDLSSNTVLVMPSDDELVTEEEIDTFQHVPLVELQCSTIGMEFESRPRSSAMKFSLAVGSLFMQDQTAKNSVFNYIICPQAKDAQSRSAFNPVSHLTSIHSAPNLLSRETEGMEFFKLAYEKRPAGHFKYSLSIKTQPLDIIYTPELIRRVKDMFNTPQAAVTRAADTVSLWQFERLKKQTQEDLKNTLDQLLEGKTSRWNINLDICAPKFIIPENTLDSNPQLVVLDLGNFHFKTMQSTAAGTEKHKDKDEDEDKFETPLSTPPNESAEDEDGKLEQQKKFKDTDSVLSGNSDNVVQDMLYEKYHIGLTEMQVLLGRLQDNWRHAYSRGTSLMHIVDRFSISVQLDRRLIVTSDTQWPTAKLSGNLPSLTFHLNERKIQGIQKCLDNFLEPAPTRLSQSAGLQSAASFDSSMGNPSAYQADAEMSSPLLESPRNLNEDNKLVALQFLINKLSLEVQSQDQALIELQVTGVQADVQTKPLNTSVLLTVHSLLLVDAFQTYGRDFDLLVASHKNIILDSRSGSIRGSEVNSPMSPMSPMSPASPGSPTPDLTPSISFTSFQSIQDALSKAFHSVMPHGPASPQSQHLGDSLDSSSGLGQQKRDSRALIQLEYEVITTPSAGDGDTNMRVLNLNFNSLDFIANQETLVEILGFIKRTFPTKSDPGSSAQPSANASSGASKQSKSKDLIHVNADFKRLNVMMVRFLASDGHKTARKVATATMSSAKLQAEFDENWEVEGSLGGLHLLDVTPDGTLYQQVVSIGQFQGADMGQLFSAPPSPSPDMYKTAMDERIFSDSFANPASLAKKNACTFVIRKQEKSVDKMSLDGSMINLHKFDRRRSNSGRDEAKKFAAEVQSEESEPFEAQFDMASLSYIHCPKFLDELVDCVSEVQDYMTGVATSIRTAATEVAMGMVGVRDSDIGATSSAEKPEDVSVPAEGYGMRRDLSLENITSSVLLEETAASTPSKKTGIAPVSSTGGPRPAPSAVKVGIIFNARMESPILIIPRKPNSSEVLIAHLGEIVVDNKGMHDKPPCSGHRQLMHQNQDLICLSLTNMNLYSLHLDQRVNVDTGEVNTAASASPNLNSIPVTSEAAGFLTSAKLSEMTQRFGVPILHDTSVDLKIGKKSSDIPYINPHHSSGLGGFAAKNDSPSSRSETCFEHVSSILDVHARISSPIKLSLSKEVYEQILQTVDHLTYDAEESKLQQQASGFRASSPFTLNTDENIPPTSEVHSESSAHSKASEIQAESRDPKTKNSSSSIGSADATSGLVNPVEPSFLAKHVDFEVPLFEVELRGNFGEGEQGLVDLKLYDFAVQYEKNDRATTHISLRLKSLQMDDLLESPESKHRQIIISKPSPKGKDKHLQRMFSQPKAMMSKSCPDSTIISPVPRMPSSLPSSFIEGLPSHHRLHHYQHLSRPQQHSHQEDHTPTHQRNRGESPGLYPNTPPPSPVARDLDIAQMRAADDLVHIDVTLVDKKRPEFVTKYNMTNRFINIDFACLEATINLQTWVVLLDFLGMGAKVHDPTVTDPQSKIQTADAVSSHKEGETENVNSEIKFHVESFTLVFNKPEYELAEATAASLRTTINLRNGNLSATGQLGSLSLLDQSPHGHLYRQRFVSTGRQVVEFDFFKYGLPDFAMQRAFDISLKLRMSSVRYIHTNRFQSELVAFAQHFLQLQDVLGRMRAASAGKKVNEQATRGARILLDIEAASPILLIPHSSETHAVLVADLGNLRLRNQFIVDGETGTLRAQTRSNVNRSSHPQPKTRPSGEPSIFHRGMTESQLNASFPPMRPIDPMAQSVYGSIEHDMRLDSYHSIGLDSSLTGQAQKQGMQRHSSDSFLMSRTHQSNRPEGRCDSLPEADELAEQGARNLDLNPEDEDYRCLLDVISVTLSDMDLFTARRVWKSDYTKGDLSADMEFSTFVVEREHGPLLKEKCLLELHIEHNLEGDLSHTAPDFCINGKLSSVVCRLDNDQYQLIRGLLNHNLGEKLEEFQRPPLSHLQNPKIQTVLSGKPWRVISLTIDLRNVTVELLHCQPEASGTPEQSLGRLDFIRSQLSFTSFSNQLREVDLVSNQIRIDDTRFKNEPVNARPNVFSSILQPSPGAKEKSSVGLQMEMHLRSAPDSTQFTVLLNNMRLMCIFDWLMAMQEFISKELPDPFLKNTAEASSSNPVSPRVSDDQPAQRKSPHSQSPLTVKVPFELVLNFADTQFVVVEDSTSLDTNAVILKNTAVILYKPQAQDKVLSCSLQSVELFSCCLMAEEDTALSIVDPTSVHVELNANPLPQPNPSASGLLGLRDAQRRQLVLEISLKVLNIRVSYHDMVMFLAIVNSLPLQARQAKQKQNQTGASSSARVTESMPSAGAMGGSSSPEAAGVQDNMTKKDEVVQLMELGFPEDDVRQALSVSRWHVDEAASWLTQNSKTTKGKTSTEDNFMLTALEVNADSIMLCLIDDCGDADIPLAEIACNALSIKQEIEPCVEGKASFTLMAEYYNRKLSGWEPFLEPWKCFSEWKQYLKPERKLAVQVAASDTLNLNVTSTLIDLYKQTSGNWTQDYQSQQTEGSDHVSPHSQPSSPTSAVSKGFGGRPLKSLPSSEPISSPTTRTSQSINKRSPFIPYVIRNDTGSNLWFLTATTTPSKVVFEVQQEGSARKLIIVRSALVLDNRLDSPIELKLEATDETGHYQCMTVPKFPEEGNNGASVVAGASSGPTSLSHLGHGVFFPTLPGHILTLLPPVTVCNLLPLELHYYLRGMGISGNLKAGREASLHGVDISSKFELGINLENFPSCKELTIPPNTHNRKVLLRIYDNNKRMLKVVVRINMVKGGAMKLTISAQFWLVNKSGLPLVFKQDGCKVPAAGQFEEHEQARSVTPLLFSFSEAEELNLCQMRVGHSVHGHHSLPHWCSPFSLEGGMSKRALHVLQHQGNRPDWVYNIGIQVTPGRGHYRGTNIVTFAPRFVLDNQSGCKLAIAQHFVTKKEIKQQAYLTALPLCSLPFHWPRVDLDQLLAVKILNIDHCRWSGGFYIDRINSFHINMRDPCGTCHLLKVEVVQQGPTFFIVFADADVMPPPFRIDNCTDVPVLYYQDQTGDDRLKTFIEPQKSIPYTWDEPTVTPLRLTLGIMGGTSASYSLDKLEEGEQLHYENFIYLAATATFDRSWNGPSPELVLDCVHNNNIMFRRKEKSKRNQLWRMTGSGMLEHEGSMPPRDPRNPSTSSEPGLVLDIADLAPRPGQCVPLTLRKPDVRRRSTQTWRFTEQGQLCCLAGMMCVQAVGGDRGLQEGAIAVLGPGPSSDQQDQLQQSIHAEIPGAKATSSLTTSDSWPSGFSTSGTASRNLSSSGTGTDAGRALAAKNLHVPRHMLISRQKLRPGSGCISVRVSMDGPIRVIELVDIQQRRVPLFRPMYFTPREQVVKRMTMEKDLEDWEVYDELKGKKKGSFRIPASDSITELSITLKNGVGVSLVNSLSEELLYLTLKNISVEVVAKPTAITFDASVAHIQADNQMGGAQRPVVLFVSPTSRRDVLDNTPALYISAHKVPSGRWKAEIFKHLYVSTKRMTVHIEEQLLWKLLQLTGMGKDDRTLHRLDETYDAHRALSAVTSIQSTRYYFGTVKLSVNRVTLSMVTSSKLTPDLKAIKNAMPMRLIAFEQANIDMRSFEQYHVFETGPFLISEITNHYGGELRGQAAKILGSIDFLGNPLGLVHDITEGIAGFVKDGNVGGLLKNVTHGVSNSTAKVVSSISDGISTVGLDEDHNMQREKLRHVTSGSSSDHIMAGFRGLSHGLVGGVTSLFSQSISGAQQEGLGGFIKGMGKGVIGTVTKPVSGVLDLTSGVANALRDSSTRTSNRDPGRVRLPRCTQGPGDLLPPYSQAASEALTVLLELNENDFSEHLIAMEQLTVDASGDGNMHVLITNRQVFFLNARRARTDNIVLKISHSDILHCSSITSDGKFYVELTRKTSLSADASSTSLNKPRVRCDRLNIAKKVAQQIKYAKNLFEERCQTLEVDDSSDEEIW